MDKMVSEELNKKRRCEACEIYDADLLLNWSQGTVIGLFHVCTKCSTMMNFSPGDKYSFYNKK